HGGEMRSHRLALPFHRFGDVEDRIDRDGVFAGSDAALLAEMTLDEVRLVEHVLVHPGPAVFLHHVMEQPERGVVVRRIGRHRLTAELRLEKSAESGTSAELTCSVLTIYGMAMTIVP